MAMILEGSYSANDNMSIEGANVFIQSIFRLIKTHDSQNIKHIYSTRDTYSSSVS